MTDSEQHTHCNCEVHSGEPVVCFQGVSYSYDGRRYAVEDADFDLYRGESVCVLSLIHI